jgi:rubrerythrin
MAIEQEKTLEALRTAIQMEIDGKQYYLKMGQISNNDLGAVLFKTLAAEEDSHLQKFEEIYKAIEEKKGWPQVEFIPHRGRELTTLFSKACEIMQSPSSELESVKTAMDMENKTRDYYQEQAKRASEEAEKIYFEMLAGEENAHHVVLDDYYEYLKNPAGWFTMKERHSLDGG